MRREYIAWFDMPKSGKLHGQSVMPKQELIRCKDCKYYRDGDCWHERENDRWIYYQSIINEPNPDDYCSRAERKDE